MPLTKQELQAELLKHEHYPVDSIRKFYEIRDQREAVRARLNRSWTSGTTHLRAMFATMSRPLETNTEDDRTESPVWISTSTIRTEALQESPEPPQDSTEIQPEPDSLRQHDPNWGHHTHSNSSAQHPLSYGQPYDGRVDNQEDESSSDTPQVHERPRDARTAIQSICHSRNVSVTRANTPHETHQPVVPTRTSSIPIHHRPPLEQRSNASAQRNRPFANLAQLQGSSQASARSKYMRVFNIRTGRVVKKEFRTRRKKNSLGFIESNFGRP
ncbi:hypothetical protein VHEMI08127 [[Torrubiella] hemipterigena]|uniref:Uncharacterized protein n=1 Tax=[Torrubiella] hemipterigena TaxID=1531966 RepID=A0A0A1T5M5_9HYPO|nr:hypothetical protein VHEMI08127 [[Torrubiella] hemipterigena]